MLFLQVFGFLWSQGWLLWLAGIYFRLLRDSLCISWHFCYLIMEIPSPFFIFCKGWKLSITKELVLPSLAHEKITLSLCSCWPLWRIDFMQCSLSLFKKWWCVGYQEKAMAVFWWNVLTIVWVQKLKANLDHVVLLAFISSTSIKQQGENQCRGRQRNTVRRWLWQYISNEDTVSWGLGTAGEQTVVPMKKASLCYKRQGSKRWKAIDNCSVLQCSTLSVLREQEYRTFVAILNLKQKYLSTL